MVVALGTLHRQAVEGLQRVGDHVVPIEMPGHLAVDLCLGNLGMPDEIPRPRREKPGRDLGYTRFDLFAESLGCHGELVEKPEDIRPALERAKIAIKNGKPALVNVVTDFAARAVTVRFTKTVT